MKKNSLFVLPIFWAAMRINTLYLIILFTLWTGMLHGQYKNVWESLSGPITESPSVCSWGVNRLDVFVRGTDNALWTKSYNGNQWTGFSQLGNEKIASDPAAVSWGPNRINVFVRGTDNMLYTKSWENNHWTGYTGLSGPIVGGPAVCSSAPNHLRVFVRGTDNALWTKGYDGNQWGGFFQLGNEKIASDPAAVSWGANRIDVFVRGTDNMLYTKSWEGDHWTGYTGLGGPIIGSPSVCSQAPNRLDVFVRLSDNTIATKSWNGSQWSGFTQVSTDVMDSDPAAISWGTNRMDVFARGTDAKLYHKWWEDIWMPVSLVEGQLYREASHLEVYWVNAGKKIWVPTPEAILGMGYNLNDMIIVPDHTLDHLLRVKIPSASPTPGSLIFPPGFKPLGNLDASHYPVKIATSTTVKSQGLDVELVEIRGWLVGGSGEIGDGMGNNEPPGSDYSFEFVPDYKWLKEKNIDINKVIWAGNIAWGSTIYGTSAKKKVTIPHVHVEVNSWLWRNRKPSLLPLPPSDWINVQNHLGPLTRLISWPFLPPNLSDGQYVSVFGSFVTDGPHDNAVEIWDGKVDRWAPSLLYSTGQPNHYGRYTEIHPADLVQPIIDNPRIQEDVTYGLLLCADIGETNYLSCLLYPLIPKPSTGAWRVAYEEIFGPECRNPTNNSSNHYTRITEYNDHITVDAKTQGGDIFSGIGRIRALYRVWWEADPNPQPKIVTITNRSNLDVTTRFYGSNDGILDILTPLLGGTLSVPANATRSWTLPTGMNTVKVTFNGSNVRSAAAGETLFWDTDERLHIFNKSRKPITARFYNAGDLLRVGTLPDGEKIIQSNQDIFWRMPEDVTQVAVTFNNAFPQIMSRSGVFNYTEKDLLFINQSSQAVTVQIFKENDPLGLVQVSLKDLILNSNSNSTYTLPVGENKVKVRFRQFGKPDQVIMAELGATLSYDRNGNVTKS